MKNSKKLLCLPLALSLSLASSTAVFADSTTNDDLLKKPINSFDINHTLIDSPVTNGPGGFTPKIEVVPQQTFTLSSGQANIPFRYQSYVDMRLYLKNTGNKTVNYEINFPGGVRNLMKSSLAPGEQKEWNLPLYDVYGQTSWGLWNIFAVTTDGSTGKLIVSARTLD